MKKTLETLPHHQLVDRLIEAHHAYAALSNRTLVLGAAWGKAQASLIAAESHAAELGLIFGEIAEALNLPPDPKVAHEGLTKAQLREAYGLRLLERIREAQLGATSTKAPSC